MDRHPLERASWVAGIVSALVAVIVWLAPQKSSTEERAPQAQPTSTQVAGGNTSPKASSQQVIQKAVPKEEGLSGDYLSSQLALADSIFGTDLRNEAYVKIINQALERNDYASAKKVIDMLFGTDLRNREYLRTIDQALSQNRLDVAEELTPKIFGTDARNAVLMRTLDARAKEATKTTHVAQPIIPPDWPKNAASR